MHGVEGATWCDPKRRDGRLRQAEASPVCARSRGRVRSRHRRRRERRWRGAEDRGGHGSTVAYGSRSLSREQRPARLSQLQSASAGYRGCSRASKMPATKAAGIARQAGVRRGLPPSELAKGVQGETAAIGRVPLVPVPVCGPASSGQGSLRNG